MTEDEINIVKSFLLGFQDQLCDRFESIDGCSSFIADKWKRESGGGGESRIIAGDGILKRRGKFFSCLWG